MVTHADENTLKIGGSLDIGSICEVRQALRELLEKTQNPVLDLSAVDACDCAGLQLLYAAQRSNPQFRCVGLPGTMAATAAALGLAITTF